MQMRTFGRTGMQLSVLGFGCGAVGGIMVRGDATDQQRTVARAQAPKATRSTAERSSSAEQSSPHSRRARSTGA